MPSLSTQMRTRSPAAGFYEHCAGLQLPVQAKHSAPVMSHALPQPTCSSIAGVSTGAGL